MNSTIKLIMINKKIIAYSSFWKILIIMNSVCISAERDGEETVWYQGWQGSLPAIRGAIVRWYVQCS